MTDPDQQPFSQEEMDMATEFVRTQLEATTAKRVHAEAEAVAAEVIGLDSAKGWYRTAGEIALVEERWRCVSYMLGGVVP